MAELRERDAGGYKHKVTIYTGLGHDMKGNDKEALPWMTDHTRDMWPAKVVWHQSGRTHDRFYWLAVPRGTSKVGDPVCAEVLGQKIVATAESLNQLTLRLSDELLDLDQKIVVTVNGEEKFNGKVERKVKAIWDSIRERADHFGVANATVALIF